MKSTQAFLAIGILTGAFAAPTQEIRDDAQTAHLKFNGESDSYTLNVKADGKTVKTGTWPRVLPIPIRELTPANRKGYRHKVH